MLGGQEGLGPADFRRVLPVTRKHLIPILGYLDGLGVTTRLETGRRVSAARPPGGTRHEGRGEEPPLDLLRMNGV